VNNTLHSAFPPSAQATAQQVVVAIAQTIGDAPAALHEPRFSGNEWEYVKECLDSTFVSSVGKFVNRFESEIAAYTGARHAVAVVNGTAALHIALKLAGLQPGDEALVPALNFVATANAVSYCGAMPHFVDCDEVDLGMSPLALREHLRSIAELRQGVCVNRATGRRICVVVPMHTFGHPVDLDGLLGVAHDFKLTLIEDAAESLGSFYQGRHTGTFGAMGALSFNGNKTITTGGGGAIITDDDGLALRAKHITTTAKLPHRWTYEHDEIGYNYRLPNLNAALGCAQLEQMPEFLSAKRRLFSAYTAAFAEIPGMNLVGEPGRSASNFWLQTLRLDEADTNLRDAILSATNDAGYMTRPVWSLMHKLQHFRDCPSASVPVAESLERRLINIPSSAILAARFA
jgi:aminotransferase in exopolysaccharide biosynthesis